MNEASMDDGLLCAKQPKPALQIGKEKVFVAIAAIGLLFTIGIVMRGGPREPKPLESSDQPGLPGYNVTTLPASYEQLPSPTPVPAPRVEVLEPDDTTSKLEELLAKLMEEKLRRSHLAKAASVNFQHLTISKNNDTQVNLPTYTDDVGATTSSGSPNPRDEANRQDDKNSFLDQRRNGNVTLSTRLMRPRSPYQLMAGTLIPGLMLTGLNSDLPGQILGQVSQSVYDTISGKYLLVPQGSKIIGQYDSRIVYGQERVLIVWTRLIFPNGKSISLEGMPGVDLSGYAGLSDQVNNHWGRLLTGVVFSSLLSAGAQIAEGRNFTTVDPSYGELATQGVAKNANQVGQEMSRKNLNVQPTLEIRPGFRFNVFVHKDMVLEPYQSF